MISKIKNKKDYENYYNLSLSDPKTYWGEVSKLYSWKKPPTKILSGNFKDVNIKWFEDGALNITLNTLDRHLETQPNKTALIFEPNDPTENNFLYTYKELHKKVCQTAEALHKMNIKKGDVICLYMSMIPELLISVLACARIGAIHSVVFGGFSARALQDRIEDCKAKLIITNDSGCRGNKDLPIKTIVDEALTTNSEANVLVWRHSKKSIPMTKGRDFYAHEILDEKTTSYPAEQMNAEDPLFILYTSGSTGKPKGLLHTTAGYMIWAGETFKHVFQLQEEKDVFWCTADIGWITGHSYITYGPLLNGVTQVMFEGIPTHPTPSRFWEIIKKHKVSHFYTAPTAIRALQAKGPSFVEKSNLDSLKTLGSVGEPINEEAWSWYKQEIGKNTCPIVDTWWQTETGGVMISNLAGVTEEKCTYATLPLPGVAPKLLTSESKVLNNEAEGHLCISQPWPGMARTIFGDHKRFINTYFRTHENHYFTGDGAKRNFQGEYRIIGRIDDVVNVSGHRIGTAEVEDVISESTHIIESAVVGASHPIKGQCLIAFVIGDNQITNSKLLIEVNNLITKELGAILKLDKIIQVTGLPKTRSGKIMRRILRKISDGESNFGDLSTLINPSIIEELLKEFK